ncbi:hypothetical protein [Pectobacterium versatile]|uniref:hypothetical protein n=1 Tax=Pectobacterium versatile TaxID=2488639 RepID=UPI001F1B2C7E|nr:hypothetical protein [Pectobacterium versatile]
MDMKLILSSTVIAALISIFVAAINNHISRIKSQNEWRRDKVLSLILEFQDEMRNSDDMFFKLAGELYSVGVEKIDNAYLAINMEAYKSRYYERMRVIVEKLELLILPQYREVLKKQFDDFIEQDRVFYGKMSMGIFHHPDDNQPLPERHDFQPLFLKIIDNLR